MTIKKQGQFLFHHAYNRAIVYQEIIDLTIEEMETLIKQFDEEDHHYFAFHNPTFSKQAGILLHPNAKMEQLLKSRNFLIRIV